MKTNMKTDEQHPEFDDYSQDYGKLVENAIKFGGQEHAFYLKFKARLLLNFIDRHFKDRKKIRVLDFGCGTGGMDIHLAPELPGLEATDISEKSVEIARKLVPQVKYAVSSQDNLPYPDQTFDLIFAVCVFHHIEPTAREKAVMEQKRLLKPGGFIVIMEHNPLNPGARLVVNRCEFDQDAVLLGSGESARLLRACGLEVLAKQFFLYFPFDNQVTRMIENALAKLPLGAQYMVAAQKKD